MAKVSLIRATSKDLKEVAKIEKIASSKTYHALTRKGEIADYIKNDFVFLIKKNNAVVGLVSFKIKNKKTATCNGLVIYPKFRGKGFARTAMVLALKKMSKYPRVDIVVHPRNSVAISLYLSLGFVIEAWRNNYFGDGEPRIIMVLVNKIRR
jgi:ribosomal protein S18 acetylase RimI-like enzyme